MEKERRKKRAIEELMARELEQTVGRGGYKRHREEKSHKRYRYDNERGDYHSLRDDYGEYSREYDTWEDRGATSYDDRYITCICSFRVFLLLKRYDVKSLTFNRRFEL